MVRMGLVILALQQEPVTLHFLIQLMVMVDIHRAVLLGRLSVQVQHIQVLIKTEQLVQLIVFQALVTIQVKL